MNATDGGDRVEFVLSSLSAVANEDRSRWSGAALVDRVTGLATVVERAEAELVRAVAGWDTSGAWAEQGDLSLAAAVQRVTAWPPVRVRRVVRCARLTRRTTRLANALAAHDLTVDHVDAMARAATGLRAALFDEHADGLIDVALRLTPSALAHAMRRWVMLADDDLGRRSAAEQHERRRLHLSTTFDGMGVLDGVLDPEGSAILATALAAFDRPDPVHSPGGVRTPAQRRADALVEIARRALADDDGVVDPVTTVHALIDVRTLVGEVAPPDEARCEVGGVSVPASAVRRLLCDSWISRVVLGPRGEILELGRRARFFTASQKRAMGVRDGGCVWPGCDRPPGWCDAHHLHPFESGGPTDLDNGVLLCRRHHRMVDDTGWALVRGPAGEWHARPP